MDETNNTLDEIDREKVKTAVRIHAPIEITTYALPREMEIYIHKILTLFLSECHQEHMNEYLNFCLGELLSNSKKANTKRVYFARKHLDIQNKEDYAIGMKTFKDDTMANLDFYLTEQKKAGLYIKIRLQLKDDYILVEICNNTLLCESERERIDDKLDKVKQYNNPEDVYKNVLDQSEGAGLGIIIIILMLKKIGLSKENYKVYTNDTETVTRIELPLNQQISDEVVKLYDDFAKRQTKIPVFNSTLNQLSFLFEDSNTIEGQILELISHDVTLSAILIKAAAKIEPDCINLEKAYNLLGLEKVKKLYSKENHQIYTINKEIDSGKLWEHSYKVAYFAYNLAKNVTLDDSISAEEIYLIALLHDIECVLIEAISNTEREDFQAYYRDIGISNEVLHMVYNNSWHSVGGYLLTQNWGLSSKLSEIIKYYKNPEQAPEEIRLVATIIYFADIMQYYDDGKVEFYQLNKALMASLGISNEAELKLVIGKIKSSMNLL